MNKEQRRTQERLAHYQALLREDESAWEEQRRRLSRQEELLRGSEKILKKDGRLAKKQAEYVRNLVAELIEAQVDSTIPGPKVTALRPQDEPLARKIEDMLRNELNRLPMEELNDLQERVTPTHGGDFFFVDWDLSLGGHCAIGDTTVTEVHPRRFVPQRGIYEIDEMEHWFLKIPRTVEFLERRYGVRVEQEAEGDPDARSAVEDQQLPGLVTEVLCYYRNQRGGIGRFAFCGDTVLEDLTDCQMRRIYRCRRCGEVGDGVECRQCGSTDFSQEAQEREEVPEDLFSRRGISPWEEREEETEGARELLSALSEPKAPPFPELSAGGGDLLPGVYGVPTVRRRVRRTVPCYRPNRYPLVLRRNVSLAGQLLGGSDADAMEDAQMATNKLGTKINQKILSGGSFTAMPRGLKFDLSDEDGRVLRYDNPAQVEGIRVFNTQVDIGTDLGYQREVYQHARERTGITDSFLGRRDPTATSGRAKEFSAAQSAGRLESKRIMKQAAYQKLFELLFRWKLAYADEPRPLVRRNNVGDKEYDTFDRWDFLEEDEAGELYWNDQFLFACDTAAPLANSRETLWQEMRGQLNEGSLGAPGSRETLILYWGIMEQLHYPLAGTIKAALEEAGEAERRPEMEPPSLETLQETETPGTVETASALPLE